MPLHPLKIGIWVAVSRRRIFGSIFFNYTINGERYRTNILEPFINQLDDQELRHGFFQQDSATAHTARHTIQYLEQYFPERLISKGLWPSRSPDLTPLDFYLFPYLKNTVHQQQINNLEELQNRITELIAQVQPETLSNVFDNLTRRVQLCLRE